MKITTGVDIIEIERIKKSIEHTKDKFLDRVYTKEEQEYCNSKNVQKYQHYAGRFAAKEAIFKAISIKLEDKYKILWKDIEILNDEQGRPKAKVEGITDAYIDVSISHCKEYAVANVVAIWKD